VPAIYPFAKSITIQEPFKFTKYKEGIKLPHNDTSRPLPQYDVMSCFRQLPMVYSWQNVYQQMYDTQIEYDLVIRSRYDMALYHQVDYNLLDGNYLNHAGNETSLDDNLCITNYTNAEKLYHNVFTKLIRISKESGILNSAEESWTRIVEHEGPINKAAIKVAKSRSISIITNLRFHRGKFDVVVMRGTIQHLTSPFEEISGAYNSLKRGGILFFLATPNIDSAYYRFFGTLPALDFPRNYWLPGFKQLKIVCEREGFKLLAIEYPYFKSGYAKWYDLIKIALKLFTRNKKLDAAFPRNMMNLAFEKTR
jgi:SAM-dependent methyltransferase